MNSHTSMNTNKSEQIQHFLMDLLATVAQPEGLDWLHQRAERIGREKADRLFYLTFSAVPRFLGKQSPRSDSDLLAVANALRPGFRPRGWTADRIARVWLLLQLPHEEEEAFVRKVEMLFSTADMGELVALYSSLPLLPYPERFTDRATEGIRTNMVVVFDAIALDNPYPADFLTEDAWNQMVLKAAFMDRPLYRIIGIEARANPKLASIISDYAHERWAAGRIVSPELWRPVGPFLNKALLEDINRLFRSENPLDRQAAALACHQSQLPAARDLLSQHPSLRETIASGAISWDILAQQWWQKKEYNPDR